MMLAASSPQNDGVQEPAKEIAAASRPIPMARVRGRIDRTPCTRGSGTGAMTLCGVTVAVIELTPPAARITTFRSECRVLPCSPRPPESRPGLARLTMRVHTETLNDAWRCRPRGSSVWGGHGHDDGGAYAAVRAVLEGHGAARRGHDGADDGQSQPTAARVGAP